MAPISQAIQLAFSSGIWPRFDEMVSALLSPLLLLAFQRAVSGVNVSIPSSPPSDAHTLSPSLLGFSIEQDRWVDWIGAGSRNDYFYNVLNNIKGLSGAATRLRIGADSEDHTNFSPDVKYSEAIFPDPTTAVPYQEASNITVGKGYYQLASFLPSGTAVVWGVNLRDLNMTAATLEANAIAEAFSSSTFKSAGVNLEAIEIGNEANLYPFSDWTVEEYVEVWTSFATNVSTTVSSAFGSKVPFWGAAFADSDTWTPEAVIDDGILDSEPGSQIATRHHYSGSCEAGTLPGLMDKPSIRSNLTQFTSGISAVHAKGLTYVLGETNSYYCHGAAGVSDTAGAALWALDYTLFSATLGIDRVYFHEGIGYKYNFIQPATLNRSIEDGTPLAERLAPHIQPAYYAAVIIAEASVSSGSSKIVELDIEKSDITGYAFFDDNSLKRAVLINMNAYVGDGFRGSVHITLDGVSSEKMTVKRLAISSASDTSGLTWGGQSYETKDGKVSGSLNVTTVSVSEGVDVSDTAVVLLDFS